VKVVPTAKVIAILGLGLIGGSLGLALRSYGPQEIKLIGWDKDEQTVSKAVARQAIHQGIANWEELEIADIIFICTPMLQVIPLAKQILPHVKAGAIITDVGSVKGCLAAEMAKIIPAGIYYIGGHPMTGREKSGIDAATRDLFEEKWYIVAPKMDVPAVSLVLLKQVLGWTGAQITTMQPERHDIYAAAISHLPHVAAAALVNTLGLYDESAEILELAGGGFCDTTRIASSNTVMWTDICLTNKSEILASIAKFQLLLGEFVTALKQEDRQEIAAFFAKAKDRRDELIKCCDK
jgi:prephenate dehydrogenase